MARQPVEAPPITPPVYGLIAAAPAVQDDSLRWGGFGFAYAPEACGVSGVDTIDCNGGPIIESLAPNPSIVEGDAFVVWAADDCSTLGYAAHDFRGRAQRQLEATRSFQIAREMWTGALRTSEGMVNRALVDTDSDELTSGAANIVDAFACIAEGIANYGKGVRGMIHVTPQLLTKVTGRNGGLLRWEGGVWLDPMRNVVVADAGYTGDGPGGVAAGATQWIYGTPIVQLRLGQVVIVPTDSDQAREMAQAMDRSINSIRYAAIQPVAYSWDTCIHVAAEVDEAVCSFGGA